MCLIWHVYFSHGLFTAEFDLGFISWEFQLMCYAQVHSSRGTNETHNRQTNDVSLDYLQLFLYTSFYPASVFSYSLFNIMLSKKNKQKKKPRDFNI